MKILLTMHMPYLPPLGGANKTIRYVAEALALRKHSVMVIVPAFGEPPGGVTEQQFFDEQEKFSIRSTLNQGAYVFHLNDVEVHAVADAAGVSLYLTSQIEKFQPDYIIVAAEDITQILLKASLSVRKCPVICIAQTPSLLPFGSHSFYPDPQKKSILKQVDAFVVNSQFLSDYVHQWIDIKAIPIYLPAYGKSPFPNFGNFESGFITLVNPCQFKGISIFIKLAEKLPNFEFAAVPTWGTTYQDRVLLERNSNISLLEPSSDFDQILSQTRILLVPSLWLENIPLVIIEAMLRGIPVISSNVGGIEEVNLGTGFMVAVKPIERVTHSFNQNKTIIPLVPDQEIKPWYDAVLQLLSNRELYYQQSNLVRSASYQFVSQIKIESFEDFLRSNFGQLTIWD
jgi:glycosyltransferase involved in cell wall biosynthesis